MGFNAYQDFVESTVTYGDSVYPILGLAGETGEFVEFVKKAWRSHNENWPEHIDKAKVVSELGDIVWYVARIASLMDVPLDDVIKGNVDKLTDRRINGKH